MTREETIKTAVERTRRANDLDERIYREAKEALENSLLIPKPKFKVGDWVKIVENKKWKVEIVSVCYDYGKERWVYEDSWNTKYSDNELQLVEAAK